MIVYFLEKSKVYLKWGIALSVIVLELYLSFIFLKITLREQNTLQIIRSQTTNFVKNSSEIISSDDILEKGKNAFVASKIGKYYYPVSCSKARTLSVKNMLYFKDKMSAESAGFKAYSGCF